MQRNVGAVKYRADPNGEILVAGVAVVVVLALFPFLDILPLAVRANHSVLPQNPGKVVDCGLLVGELLYYFVGRKDFDLRLFLFFHWFASKIGVDLYKGADRGSSQ